MKKIIQITRQLKTTVFSKIVKTKKIKQKCYSAHCEFMDNIIY